MTAIFDTQQRIGRVLRSTTCDVVTRKDGSRNRQGRKSKRQRNPILHQPSDRARIGQNLDITV